MRLISISDRRIPPFLILFGLSLDMGGDFGLRIYFLAGAFLFYLLNISFLLPRSWLYLFAVLCAYPSILLLGSLIGKNDFDIAVSQYSGTIFGFMVILFLYQYRRVNLILIYFYAILITAALTNILAVGLLLGVDAITSIVMRMSETTGGFFGLRSFDGESLYANIYFKSTLFFPSGFLLAIFYRKPLSALVFLLACIFSLSKVGVAMCLVGMIAIAFVDKDIRKSRFALALALLIPLAAIYSPVATDVERVFVGDSETLIIRQLHMTSVLALWQDNLFNFLFGFGLGHQFYSLGAGGIVSNIEIDHVNTIRKYGLIWFVFSFLLLLYLVRMLINKVGNKLLSRYLILALVITFFAAGTNPVLISPLFFAFIGVIFATVYRRFDYV